jgi:transcriptional regulator with XRE-family HTH domain
MGQEAFLPTVVRDEELRKSFGLRIRELRKQRAWTQRDVAERIRVQVPLFNRYEAGIHAPPMEKLVELAEVFDTTVDFLVTGNETDTRPLHNRRLLERFRALETFEADDQETVIKLIDAMIVKHRAESAVKPLESRPRTQARRAR